MRGREQVLKSVGGVVAVLVAIAGAAYAGGIGPFAATGDGATSDQLLNRAQVARITASPHVADVALPLDLPPHLDYVQAIRTEPWGSEVTFQEGGQHVIVCGGTDVDNVTGTGSGCEAETATVFRDESVNGRRIRVAWVTGWDGTTKTPPVASPEHAQVETFWKNVDLQLGVPSWLRTFD